MICSAKKLKHARAVCGGDEVGKVDDILFDSEIWIERYFVVAVGSLIDRKKVLVSPRSVRSMDHDRHLLELDLTKSQLEESPALEDLPTVSMRDELNHYRYYKWPFYFTGAGTFGVEGFPDPAPLMPPEEHFDRVRRQLSYKEGSWDEEVNRYLRSTKEVIGYRIHASNGVFGHIDDFLFDDGTWKIQSIIVNPRNWWLSKGVKLSPREISGISWDKEEVFVKAPKEKIIGAPYKDSPFAL